MPATRSVEPESGIEVVSVFVSRRGGHFVREIAADVLLATDCGP